jgi:hypothetical protein
MTVKELEKKIRTLERRLEKLERSSRPRNGRAMRKKRARRQAFAIPPEQIQSQSAEAQLSLEIARRAGLLAELPPEAKARAEQWRALPEDEKKRIWDEFFNLKLDKSLSDIIIENRR